MSFPITFNFAVPPEGTCPTTFTEAVALLQTLLTGEVTSNFLPYVIGASTPAVDDQNKAWIKLDAAGRPLGTFIFYSGTWRRQYTGKAKEVAIFNGDPSLYFDGTGKGLTTADWDGWALCNGLNGTPNLTDRFITAAHLDNSDGQLGYTFSSWRTMMTGASLQIGGSSTQTLTLAQIPMAATPALLLDTFQADGNARSDSGNLYGVHSVATSPTGYDTLIAADAGNAATPVFTIPRFYAMAICQFIGYA